MRQTPVEPLDLDLPAERSLRRTLIEFATFLSVPIGVVGFASSVASGLTFPTSRFDWESWWFLHIGRAFLADAAWFLPTLLAILLALYVALIGQSPPNTPLAGIRRTRVRFARAGLALASITVVFFGSGVAAAIATPAFWPRIPLVFVASSAICLLGIGVGRFEWRSSEVQLAAAKETLEIRVAQAQRLPTAPKLSAERTRLPRPWLVIAVTFAAYVTLCTAPAPIAATLDRMSVQSSIELIGLSLFVNIWWGVFGLLIPVALIRWSFDDVRPMRVMKSVISGILTLALAGYAITFGAGMILDSSDAQVWNFGTILISAPGVVLSVAAAASLFARGRTRHPHLFALTLRSAVEESARLDARRIIARLETEISILQAKVAPPEIRRSLLSRAIRAMRFERAPIPLP
jgi:hypothetical protein